MSLFQLLDGLTQDTVAKDLLISGIRNDSRHINPGDLFIAYQGDTTHGLNFLPQAIEQGACAVVKDEYAEAPDAPIPVATIINLRKQAGLLASRWYEDPSKDLPVFAVTGTDGKTSVAQFVSQALQSLGKRCGVIGTLGVGVVGDLEPSPNTTPDALFIQRFVADLKHQGGECLVLEASSHGIDQGRLSGLAIDVAILTNIGEDHFDYHASQAAYVEAKCELFRSTGLATAVINRDSEYWEAFRATCSSETQIVEYSRRDASAEVFLKSLASDRSGLTMHLSVQGQEVHLRSALLGEFNADNLMATLLALYSQGIDLEAIATALERLGPVRGRMEPFEHKDHGLVILDYAHTPQALSKALDASRHYCSGQLTCVFGCGGERDVQKRPVMGELAAQKADRVIVTDDNPRNEDPDAIIRQICTSKVARDQIEVIRDRRCAIQQAVLDSKPGDVVLVAGKGHETTQQLGVDRVPFSDATVIKECLGDTTAC